MTATPKPTEHREPTETTIKKLYATAFRCGFPGCPKPLYRVHDETGDLIRNSTVAHIHARRENGPRWNPDMSEAQNRNRANLILLCLDHSSEVDEIPDQYPAEDMRSWKVEQFAEYERVQKSWPLTDEEVREVAQASFNPRHNERVSVEATSVAGSIRLARLLIETVQASRSAVIAIGQGWEDRRRFYTQRSGMYDAETGETLPEEPPRTEKQSFMEEANRVLGTASGEADPLVRNLVAELHTTKAASPALAEWCEWVERAARKVLLETNEYSHGSPAFADAVADLDAAATALASIWRGEDQPPPPPAPLPASPPIESDEEAALRMHIDAVDRARPWARVATLSFDAAIYTRLVDAVVYSVRLPPTATHMTHDLRVAAALAADVARNASDEEFADLVDGAVVVEPLAASIALLGSLGIMAKDTGREHASEAAKERANLRLEMADWSDGSTWEHNALHCSTLLNMLSARAGLESVVALVAESLRSVPTELVLVAIATWRESYKTLDFDQPGMLMAEVVTLPDWLPTEPMRAAVLQTWPQVVAHAEPPRSDDLELRLAAQFLALTS